MRVVLALLLLTLQLWEVSAPGLCLLRSEESAQVCSHENSGGLPATSRAQQSNLPLNQPEFPTPTGCGIAGWCLAGWLMAADANPVLRLCADVHESGSISALLLKSIYGSPPVPPPIA